MTTLDGADTRVGPLRPSGLSTVDSRLSTVDYIYALSTCLLHPCCRGDRRLLEIRRAAVRAARPGPRHYGRSSRSDDQARGNQGSDAGDDDAVQGAVGEVARN